MLAILEIWGFLRNLINFGPAIVLLAIPCSRTLGYLVLMSKIPPEEDTLNELVAAPNDAVADALAKKTPKFNYRAKTSREACTRYFKHGLFGVYVLHPVCPQRWVPPGGVHGEMPQVGGVLRPKVHPWQEFVALEVDSTPWKGKETNTFRTIVSGCMSGMVQRQS